MNMNRKSLIFTLVFAPTVLAGPSKSDKDSEVASSPVAASVNPLSFFDGKVVLDLQERIRFEGRENNFDFNDSVDALTDDTWMLQRFRLGLKVKPTPWLVIYAQAQDTREFLSDRPDVIGRLGAEGNDRLDLRQGYVEIGDPAKMSFKLGRQILTYGDERVVGPLDWVNQGRTFDAVKLHVEQPSWWVDLFASSVVRFDDGEFNKSDWLDSDDTRDQVFSGVYFSSKAFPIQVTDAYLFHLSEDGVGDTDFFTLGTRMKSDPTKLNGWDYEMEMAIQFGDVRGRDLSSFAGHWGIGYKWKDVPWAPRLGVEYNFATGDGNVTDGEIESFQNLFPTNHKFYGYMDVFSWQNMHNPAISLSATPSKTTRLQLDYHMFWLADTSDGWYRANGTTLVRPINSKADRFAGSELDLSVTWKPNKNISFLAGYSHLFAGGYLDDTGAGDDADFAYLQMTIEF